MLVMKKLVGETQEEFEARHHEAIVAEIDRRIEEGTWDDD